MTAKQWPRLAVADWKETREGLLRRMQILGKLTLTGAAPQNHWWHVPLRTSPRGVRSSLLRAPASGPFEVSVDFIDHFVQISTARDERRIPLIEEPLRVFYETFCEALRTLSIPLPALPRPVEVPDPATPFASDDGYSAYDPHAVNAFWRMLVAMDGVFDEFGSRFVGKASRPGLWWGAIDYAAARYSGRTAPQHPGGAPNVADWVMTEGYSHEVAAYGYFADAASEGCFYAYTYPTPSEYPRYQMSPDALWSEELGEWLLPYHLVREAENPANKLLEFLQASYDAAAECADWPRDLQRNPDGRSKR